MYIHVYFHSEIEALHHVQKSLVLQSVYCCFFFFPFCLYRKITYGSSDIKLKTHELNLFISLRNDKYFGQSLHLHHLIRIFVSHGPGISLCRQCRLFTAQAVCSLCCLQGDNFGFVKKTSMVSYYLTQRISFLLIPSSYQKSHKTWLLRNQHMTEHIIRPDVPFKGMDI